MALDESEKAMRDDEWGKQHEKLTELVQRLAETPWPGDAYKWAQSDVWRWLMYCMGRLDADEKASIDDNPGDSLHPYAEDLAGIRKRGGAVAEFERGRFKWRRLRRIPVSFIRVLGIYEDPEALGRDMAALGWVTHRGARNVWFLGSAPKKKDAKAKKGFPGYAYERDDGRTAHTTAMIDIGAPIDVRVSAGVRFPATEKEGD